MSARRMLLHSAPVNYKDLRKVFTADRVDRYRLSRKKDGFKYYEIASSFDIETSSFYEGSEKRACMYIWQFGIDGHVFIGRTWKQLQAFCNDLMDLFALGDDYRLIVYVHNLAYEFQFMRKWFNWIKVFAIKSRTPVYAVTDMGIEFRCSYLLSGYSLAKVGEHLTRYPVQKKSGDLDYSKIRHSKTPLTDVELGYCVNDALVVMAYIQETMEQEGSIRKIPLTKTGYVRRYCRASCTKAETTKKSALKRWRFNTLMHDLTLHPDEYRALKRAFMGGYTHASAFYSGGVVENVTSYDFTSSYPYVLVSEQYPMSAGEMVVIKSDDEFIYNLKHYCCMFDLELWDVEEKFLYDHYISLSRCYSHENAVTDNGRVVKADYLRMTITEQDYLIIRKTYTWSRATVRNFYRYHKSYLPTDLVKAILKLYADKTKLRGIESKEAEYYHSKEMVNSVYGCMVTDICRSEIAYGNNEWLPEKLPDIESEIAKYNSGYSRFTYYPWGVWCTAYARRNLWGGILEFADDYIYSDTDSIKAVNIDAHMKYLERYNRDARKKLEIACRYHGIPIEEMEPQTIEGVKKPLGIWDFDGHYKRFKTLGAKRYMVEYSDSKRNKKEVRGSVNITVSGLNKKITVPYLCEGWRSDRETREDEDSPFEAFRNGLEVPAAFTGKQTHTYIDEAHRGHVKDYLGTDAAYYERSCIHMEGAEYSLSIAQEYIDFMLEREEID